MRLSVSPPELDVAVGEPIVLQVEVFNSRPVIDGFRASLLGMGDQPFTSEPPTLSLFPDTAGLMLISFTLPADVPAGPRVIGVKVASVTDPGESAAREIQLNVAPVSAATVSVEPLTVTAGPRAELSVIVANQGNVALDAAVRGTDSLGTLAVELDPPVLPLGPGQVGASRAVVSGRRPFFGSPVPHQLTFTVEGPPQPLQAAATFMQKPVLPRGVLTVLSIVLAVALWGVVLFLAANQIADKVTKEAEIGEPYAELPGGGGVLASVAGKVTAKPDAKDATVSLLPVPGENGASTQAPPPVTTPESGEYRIENVPAPGVYQVVFAKDGLGTQSRLIEVKLGEQLTGVDVTLVGGSAAVSGQVADAKGPVGAATVTASNGTEMITTVTSPSGPVGSYALESLPAPATYLIAVSKEGFGTQTGVVDVAPNQRVSGRNVMISQGKGSISGTVFNKRDGLPMGDVTVTVRAGSAAVPTTALAPASLHQTQPGPDVLGSTKTLTEGPIGFYAVTGLATPGTFTVTFEKQGFFTNTSTVALQENGNETGLGPLLQPLTGVVAGTVAQDIRRLEPCEPLACPLSEVQVKVTDRNGSEVRNTTTASSPAESVGRYEVAGLAPGRYTVTFSKTGYVPQTFSIDLRDNEPLPPLDVTLRGAPTTVTGKAPNCTAVDLLLRGDRQLDPPVSATVRDGTYRLARVETPGEYRLVFRNATSSDGIDIDLDAGETDVEVNGACPPPTTELVTRAPPLGIPGLFP